jgi:hypothetical protein
MITLDKLNNNKMIIGLLLRKLREKKGLLFRQAMAYIEVGTTCINKMEQSEQFIKREFILQLSKCTVLTPKDFLPFSLHHKFFHF